MRHLAKILLSLFVASVAFTASAANTTTTFTVHTTVNPTCTVTATSVNLGVYDTSSATPITGNTAIVVSCVKGTAYTVGLSSANSWKLVGLTTTTESISYDIKQPPPNGSTVWDLTNVVSKTATGKAPVTLSGIVTAVPLADVSSQTYQDTVTVTVTW